MFEAIQEKPQEKSTFGWSFLTSILVYGSIGTALILATAQVREMTKEREVDVVVRALPLEDLPEPEPQPSEPTPQRNAVARPRRGSPASLTVPQNVPSNSPSDPSANAPMLSEMMGTGGNPYGFEDGEGDGEMIGGPAAPQEMVAPPSDAPRAIRTRPRALHREPLELSASDFQSFGSLGNSFVARIEIDTEGRVVNVSILQSATISSAGGPALERLLQALRGWRFVPETENGRRIHAVFLQPIRVVVRT